MYDKLSGRPVTLKRGKNVYRNYGPVPKQFTTNTPPKDGRRYKWVVDKWEPVANQEQNKGLSTEDRIEELEIKIKKLERMLSNNKGV